MINAEWHRAHLMPKKASPKQKLRWHLQHQKHCGCRKLTEAQRRKLVEAARK